MATRARVLSSAGDFIGSPPAPKAAFLRQPVESVADARTASKMIGSPGR
jgi:hypothetical protein